MSNAALIEELRNAADIAEYWPNLPPSGVRSRYLRAADALEVAEAPKRFVQQMIEDCLPGGHSCDPQQVADAIRAWAKARGLE